MIIQFCGLSGSGKTILARRAKQALEVSGTRVELLDGDVYRKSLCSDLGFSQADRHTNIRRLAFVASRFANHQILPIICAINPYEAVRREVAQSYHNVKTVYLQCSLDELIRRDTKGLYAKAMLHSTHPGKLYNLTGVNDPFEAPADPDLVIHTDREPVEASAQKLISFITKELKETAVIKRNTAG